jgi:hypothetical protein
MLHSQLNIILPDRPYIWNTNNMREDFKFNNRKLIREELMAYLQDLSTKVTEPDKIQNSDLVDYLDRLTLDPMNIYTIKHYTLSSQKYPTVITNKNLFINFHTTVYADEIGTLIDQVFDSLIEWFIIPLIGKVNQNPYKSIQNKPIQTLGTKNTKSIVNNTTDKITITDKIIITDNKHSLKKETDKLNRIRKRHHPSNTILPNPKRQDIIKEINIEMLPDTKNPFEYIKESIGISKPQILFNFSNINSGRINISFEKKTNPVYFISVMRHKIKQITDIMIDTDTMVDTDTDITKQTNDKYILYVTLHELILDIK